MRYWRVLCILWQGTLAITLAASNTRHLTSLHLFLIVFLKKRAPANRTPGPCEVSSTSTSRNGKKEGCWLISLRLCSACFRVPGDKDASKSEGRSDMDMVAENTRRRRPSLSHEGSPVAEGHRGLSLFVSHNLQQQMMIKVEIFC